MNKIKKEQNRKGVTRVSCRRELNEKIKEGNSHLSGKVDQKSVTSYDDVTRTGVITFKCLETRVGSDEKIKQ